MLKRALVPLLLLCCTAVAAAQPAKPAPPPPAFTAEFQAGVDAFRLGQYDEAVKRLSAAAQMAPTLPGPHRFLAAVAAAQQRWGDCITSARTAIQLNPLSAEIEATRKLHDDCREADGRPGFAGDYAGGGAISVTANVAGATVTVGGLKYGATPLAPRALALGEVVVTAEKGGWKPAESKVTILPGVVTDVALTLEEQPAVVENGDDPDVVAELGWLRITAPPGAKILIDGKPATVDERGRYALSPGDHELDVDAPGKVPQRRTVRVSKGQEASATFELEDRGARMRRRSTGKIATLAAVGLGAVGVVTGVMAIRAADDARDAWITETTRPSSVPLSESGAVRPVHTRAEVEDMADRSRRYALISNISYGAAAVALGVGVYFLARSSDERPPPRTVVAPVVGEAWGVAITGALP